MKITEAIEKAIDGGWDDDNFVWTGGDDVLSVAQIGEWKYDYALFLDPAFWFALGKAMGWEVNHSCDAVGCSSVECGDAWLHEWHSLIDHLASGGSVEEWFGKLK